MSMPSLAKCFPISPFSAILFNFLMVFFPSFLLTTYIERQIKINNFYPTVNQPSSGQTSKKGKKKMLNNPGVILQKENLEANADVCQAALQCLSTILLCCGPRIKPTIHKVGFACSALQA